MVHGTAPASQCTTRCAQMSSLLLRAAAACALLQRAAGACVPQKTTLNGQNIMIGSTDPDSTAPVAESTVHCAKVCNDGAECQVLDSIPYAQSFMCCDGNFQLMCDGQSQCGATYNGATGQWGRVPNGACALSERNVNAGTIPPCGLDEEQCGGLRTGIKGGTFAQLVVNRATGAITNTPMEMTTTIGAVANFAIEGQIQSDFTQDMCLDEPTYEAQHRVTVSAFVFAKADYAASGINVVDPAFVNTVTADGADPSCTTTSMSSSDGAKRCGSITIDTELTPVVHYKPPENFLGTVTFKYDVQSTPRGAVQPADTGLMTLVATFVAPECVATPTTFCGAHGKCSSTGCICEKTADGGWTGQKCDIRTSKVTPEEESTGGFAGWIFFMILVCVVGGVVWYFNNPEHMVDIVGEEKYITAHPPAVPAGDKEMMEAQA